MTVRWWILKCSLVIGLLCLMPGCGAKMPDSAIVATPSEREELPSFPGAIPEYTSAGFSTGITYLSGHGGD